MALFDKLSQAAKTIGDKAGEAVETGKHSAKILTEKSAMSKEFEKIGEFYYNLYIAGGQVAPEVTDFCESARAHAEAMAAAQAEIDRIRAINEPPAAPAGMSCPACGKVNTPGTRFCSDCGSKLEAAQSRVCPACGQSVAPGVRFCPACGQKMEG